MEENLRAQMAERPRQLMWVRGHQGEAGSEEADRRAKLEARMEERLFRERVSP